MPLFYNQFSKSDYSSSVLSALCMNSLILYRVFSHWPQQFAWLPHSYAFRGDGCYYYLFHFRNVVCFAYALYSLYLYGIYPFSTLPWFVDLQDRKASNSNAMPLALVKKTHVQNPAKETNFHFRKSVVHAMRVV